MKYNVALLYLCIHVTCASLTWRKVSETGPTARDGSALAYDKWSDVLVMFGGDIIDHDTWIYNLSSNEWNTVAANTTSSPLSRKYAYFGLVRVNDTSLFVVSHGVIGEQELSDTWTFNMDTYTWNQPTISGTGPANRYGGHYGTLFEGSNIFWMGGGFTLTTPLATRYIDTYQLIFDDISNARWIQIYPQPTIGNQFNPLVPHGRCLQGSGIVNNYTMVLWGGCMRRGTGGGPCPADDGWVFETTNKQWSELPRCITPRVWGAMAPLSNDTGKAILYGGLVLKRQVIIDHPWPENEIFIVDTATKTWTRYLVESEMSEEFPERRYAHAMAAGSDGTVYMFGGILISNNSRVGDLWSISGDPQLTVTVDCDNIWFSRLHVHGLFMVIAFGILFPTGALVARYYHCKKSKVWFIIHVSVQFTAVIFTIPAFVIVFVAGASQEPSHPHAVIGIILMAITLVQPINGILRPRIKKDKEKSLYRKFWEWFHFIWGVTIIVIGLVQVTLGVFLIVPPQAVWAVWIVILCGWAITFIVHETIKWICCFFKNDDDKDRDIEMK